MNRDLRIDLLRTLAITLMVLYHAAYDLAELHGWNVDVFTGGWWLLARTSLVLFLLVSGISYALSHRSKGTHIRWKRWMHVAGAALLVSVATYVMDPTTFVQFGVLHLIAVSALLLPFFARLKTGNIVIGVMIAVAGFFSAFFTLHSAFFIPLGFPPLGFTTVDYVPLIPWFGVVLMGYGVGYLWKPHTDDRRILNMVSWPGRHSLLIYLVHQPILFALLFALHP